MQRLIISLKFVNSKCDNFRFFHCAWANYYSDKDESIWKILAIENQLPDIGFKHRVLLHNSF